MRNHPGFAASGPGQDQKRAFGVFNGLTLTGVDPFWQNVARGTLLIGAVSFDRLRSRLL